MRVKLHEALIENTKSKDHITLVRMQVQGLKEKTDETMQSQLTPNILIL